MQNLPSPLSPPTLRSDLPVYPAHLQLLRVTPALVPGPVGTSQAPGSSWPGPTLYVSFVQQLRTDTLIPQDREPCLVDDVNGMGLAPAFYLGRLSGFWSGLPVYTVSEAPVTSGSGTSTNSTFNYIGDTFNYLTTPSTVNYNIAVTYTAANTVNVTKQGGGTYSYDTTHLNFTSVTSVVNNWALSFSTSSSIWTVDTGIFVIYTGSGTWKYSTTNVDYTTVTTVSNKWDVTFSLTLSLWTLNIGWTITGTGPLLYSNLVKNYTSVTSTVNNWALSFSSSSSTWTVNTTWTITGGGTLNLDTTIIDIGISTTLTINGDLKIPWLTKGGLLVGDGTTSAVKLPPGANYTVPVAQSSSSYGIDYLAGIDSIKIDATGFHLDGDSAAPGNFKMYATDGSGVKAWYDWSSGGTVDGSGTLNTIPLWTPDGDTLGNSLLTQPAAHTVRVDSSWDLFRLSDSVFEVNANTAIPGNNGFSAIFDDGNSRLQLENAAHDAKFSVKRGSGADRDGVDGVLADGSDVYGGLITSSGGSVGLAKGGTGADLSATGGVGQILQQSLSGATISVGPLSSLLDALGGVTGTF